MRVLIICAAMAVLSGCHQNDEAAAASRARWNGAVVVKVCRNGTYIYRLPNGEHWTGDIGRQRVDNPETVCG